MRSITLLAAIILSSLLFFSCSPTRTSSTLTNSPTSERGGTKGQDRLFPVQQNNKWGYCDKTGNIVIKPQFDYANEFREGLAAVGVKVASTGGYYHKYGFINSTGAFAIAPKFKYAGFFSEGLASVQINDKRGYIDQTGNLVIQPRYDEASDFSDGGAAVKVGSKYGFIDRSGRYIIAPRFNSFYGFSEGLAVIAVGEVPNQKHGYIDKTGQFVIEPQFDFAHNFSEGLAVVTVGKYPNNRDGFIDQSGKFVINPQFEHARNFSEGLAQVVVEGKWGYIDKKGQYVIHPQFDYADQFSEGLAAIEVRRSHGYIDKTGKIEIPLQFDRANPFSGGVAQVALDEKDVYIDQTGKLVWASLELFSPKLVSDEEQEKIVQQMINDKELTTECVEEGGGSKKAVRVELIDLNQDSTPELLISGKQGCTCGARRCYQWIYRKTENGCELILSAGPADSIKPLNISTNRYFDLEISGPSGNDFVIVRYRFDGRLYQEGGCEIVKYLGERKGEPVFGRPRPCGGN
jgi:WG repeat protein